MFVGTWIAFPFALFAGALVTVQAGSNAQLRQSFGSAMRALLVNYVLGFTVVRGHVLIARVPWPTTDRIGAAPWWAWIGGLSGAAYGMAAILLASQLGATTLMALAVSGQLLISVALDHFCLLGFEAHPAGWARMAGCILMVCGFVLIAKF
jgi:transporter family-2 protein